MLQQAEDRLSTDDSTTRGDLREQPLTLEVFRQSFRHDCPRLKGDSGCYVRHQANLPMLSVETQERV